MPKPSFQETKRKYKTALQSSDEGGLYINDHTCDVCRVMGCSLYSHTDCHLSDDHSRVRGHLLCELCQYSQAAIKFKVNGSWLCTNCHALSDILYSSNPLAGTQQDPVLFPVSSSGTAFNTISAEKETMSSGNNIPKQRINKEDKLETWLLLEPDNENENLQAWCSGSFVCNDQEVSRHYTNNLVDNDNSSCSHQHQIPSNFHSFGNESDGVAAAQSFQVTEQQQEQLQPDPFYGASEVAFTNTPPSGTAPVDLCYASISPDKTIDNTRQIINAKSPDARIKLIFSSSSLSVLPPQFIEMNRKAKVQRFREKIKARKLKDKNMRCQSRKSCYAQIRPRVKGKFIRKQEMD